MQSTRFALSSILVTGAFLLFNIAAMAQFETATVIGTVKDPSGAMVTGSKVTLENTKTGITNTTETAENGDYSFLNVKIGTYRVKAESAGFKTAVAEVFTVTVSARQRVDLTLSVGDTTQTVEVQGAASALETDSSDRGQVVSRETLVNLPLNGRSYADLALLAPGVRKSAISDRESAFNVNGMRSSLNNFQVDGLDNNAYATSNQGYSNQVVQVNPDAVAEFKVQTNNYSAEYGRSAGAVINVSIRSGTNQFHGAAWEYLRNTSLNAAGYFRPTCTPGRPCLQKPIFQQNQFGAAFGGPIVKNKTFFFVDYEGLRRVTRALQFPSIATVDQRNGIFGTPIVNPYTGEVYSNGIIPQSQITPFARKVFSQLPEPSRPGLASNYDALPRVPTNDDKGDVKVDQYFTSKLTAFGRYSHREYNQIDNPSLPLPLGSDSSNGNVHIVNKQAAGGLTYTLSPTSLIEFRMAVTKSIGGKFPLLLGSPGMLEAYGIPGLPTDASLSGGLNTQNISGYTAMGRRGSTPQFQNPLVINPKVNYSKILSHHTMKLGWEYQRIDTEILDFSPQYGLDSYAGQFSKPAAAARADFYNIADFLFGARDAYELTNNVVVNYRQRMNFFYVQDDWKVNNKLTLNLGVRYEYATPQWERDNRLGNFDPVAKKLIQASAGDIYQRALVKPDRNNWAPRIGFAYNIDTKTVLRSGYGVSYVHFNRMGGENILSYNGPTVVDTLINQVPTNPTCAPDQASPTCFRPTALGFVPSMASPAFFGTQNSRTNYTPANNRTAYVQNWHFTVQRELGKSWVLDLAYVGNRGNKLMILGDLNTAAPNQPGQNVALNLRRPIQGFGFIQQSWGGGFSDYHALQTKVERRFSAGVYFLNSFTWSKSIDNAAGHLETANGDNSRVNFNDLKNEKGIGSYNQPLNNTTTLVYTLPFGKGMRFGGSMNPMLNAVLGGWRSTLINTMASGQALNLTYGPSSQFQVSTAPTYRPNLTGANIMLPESQRNIDNYFNKDAILVPTDVTRPFGNAGRNIARAPAYYNADLGLHKDFPVFGEGRKLEFRSEFFNVLNKTNFGAPNTTRSSSGFGQTRSTYPTRVIQFALKFVF